MLFVEEFAEFVECERKYEKNYVHCFVDRKFLEISREFESRDCVMLSSICTVAPTFIGPTTMKFPVLKDLKQEKLKIFL